MFHCVCCLSLCNKSLCRLKLIKHICKTAQSRPLRVFILEKVKIEAVLGVSGTR